MIFHGGIRKHSIGLAPLMFAAILVFCSAPADADGTAVSGELKQWHKITIAFTGPGASEAGSPNPFTDYRLNVTFTHGDSKYTVPGYYAADGNAGETGAENGNQWKVHFAPDETGEWSYRASFREGSNIAIESGPNAGKACAFDGAEGTFLVGPSGKTGRDFRGKGMPRYVGERYLQFAGSGEWFLKGGADSPENFLAYAGFDGTYFCGGDAQKSKGEADHNEKLHRYEPHAKDWKTGDPDWRGGKGKNIIGALNYLSSKGMNSVYFLTMNVNGDGKDVWPWTSHNERFRFDCSKLDQWETVFSHMDRLGLMLHVITQEVENCKLLDKGELGPERKFYYRELIARFAHHPAIVWNLGEENNNTNEQRKEFSKYIYSLDAYHHPITVHTWPGKQEDIYRPLLNYPSFHGPSLQIAHMSEVHEETLKWVRESAKSGRNWFVCLDEIGPANVGVLPDAEDWDHDQVRRQPLWGNLMAGGSGCEWYFGYQFAHNDLNCEDWRSRDHLWDLTRFAIEFFQNNLPFTEMTPDDELTGDPADYCLAKPGEVYAIYLPYGVTTDISLAEGEYSIRWYDPREGGELQDGTLKSVRGPGKKSIGFPPRDIAWDWAVVVRRK